jgi:hypothetical protein
MSRFLTFYKLSLSLASLATAHYHVGAHLKCIRPTEDIFNPEDPKIREVKKIMQTLIFLISCY